MCVAPITNISKSSLHDGPGIRTVVYFKGCGLKCRWCHNPETLSFKKQVLYFESKCIRCGRCIEVCPEHHIISEDDMVFVREGCSACGKCVDVCPSLALSLCGENKTVDEVFAEIEKDSHYYAVSKGGVTFSGGECLLYPKFLKKLMEKCKTQGINTAIESSLYVPWENVEAVLPYTDLFFADLKVPDSQKHLLYTGKDNGLIIENIRKLSNNHDNVIIRIPVIPGVNDKESDMEEFSEIIKTLGKGIKGIELLKYNNLAETKYESIDYEYIKFAENPQSNEDMENLYGILSKYFGDEVLIKNF